MGIWMWNGGWIQGMDMGYWIVDMAYGIWDYEDRDCHGIKRYIGLVQGWIFKRGWEMDLGHLQDEG